MKINRVARAAFQGPNNNRSEASTSSILFMTATTAICSNPQSFGFRRLSIQSAIPISSAPISWVIQWAFVCPRMRATICSCLGTAPSNLQNRPLISHTIAMTIRIRSRQLKPSAGLMMFFSKDKTCYSLRVSSVKPILVPTSARLRT